MKASELFQAGRLTEAIDAQINEVRAHPADHARRLFLFELLAFAGDLDRARKQIDAIRFEDSGQQTSHLEYRALLESEQARRRLFSEGLAPHFLIDPPPAHVPLRLEAVNRLREGRPDEAAELLERANAESPAIVGQLNGKPFSLLRDADDLFGTVLEVLAQGRYFWVPLEQVETIMMNPPSFPRDLLWFPARIALEDATGDAFLPVLYPRSHEHADPQIKLGRATDWTTVENGPVLGVGARTFLVDDDSLSLLEWREYLRGTQPASGAPETGEST